MCELWNFPEGLWHLLQLFVYYEQALSAHYWLFLKPHVDWLMRNWEWRRLLGKRHLNVSSREALAQEDWRSLQLLLVWIKERKEILNQTDFYI